MTKLCVYAGEPDTFEKLTCSNTDPCAADGRSVYVKNLPMNITVQQLESELSKFGPVKAGGVNVKNQKVRSAINDVIWFYCSNCGVSLV